MTADEPSRRREHISFSSCLDPRRTQEDVLSLRPQEGTTLDFITYVLGVLIYIVYHYYCGWTHTPCHIWRSEDNLYSWFFLSTFIRVLRSNSDPQVNLASASPTELSLQHKATFKYWIYSPPALCVCFKINDLFKINSIKTSFLTFWVPICPH